MRAFEVFQRIMSHRILNTFLRTPRAVLCAAAIFAVCAVTHAGPYDDYAYSMPCTLKTTTAGLGVNVVNFPMLVQLTSTSDVFAHTQTDGDDVRFTKSDRTTPLYYELERWDDNDSATFWVRIDTAYAATTNPVIYIYYDKAAATSGSTPNDVFQTSNGFVGVWHMDDSPAGGLQDATSNNITGTARGSMGSGNVVLGVSGQSTQFTRASSQYYNLTNGAAVDLTGDVSMGFSAWVNTDGLAGTFNDIITKGDEQYHLRYVGTKWEFCVHDGSTWVGNSNTETPTVGTWYYVCGYRDHTKDSTYLYSTGRLRNQVYVTSINSARNDTLAIGAQNVGTGIQRYWNGRLDEVRMESVRRDSNWVKLCYATQRPDSSFKYLGFGPAAANSSLTRRIWDGGGGATVTASTAANWDGDILPTANDTVVFNSTSDNNCTWDLNLTLNAWEQLTGYDGTVTCSYALDVNGDITITGGTLNSNGNNITVAGGWTNSATYTPGANTVTFDGGVTQSLNSGGTGAGKSFNNLATATNNTHLDLSTNQLDVNGSLTIAASTTLHANSLSMTVAGAWSNSGTFTPGANTVTFDGTVAGQTLNAGASSFYNVNVAGSGGVWTLATNSMTVANSLRITAGTLDPSANTKDLTVTGNLNIAGGTLTATNTNLDVGGDDTLNTTGTFTAPGSSKTFSVGGNCWFLSGSTYTNSSGMLTLDGTASGKYLRNSNATNFNKLAITGSGSWTLTNDANLTITDSLKLSAGTLVQGSTNITAAGFSLASGSTWRNWSTGDIVVGAAGVTNAGTIDFNGNGTACGDNDDIAITSSAPGTDRQWSGAGTFTLTDVSVTDQNATVAITVNSGTPSSNTGSWTFGSCPAYVKRVWNATADGNASVTTNWNPNGPFAVGDTAYFDGVKDWNCNWNVDIALGAWIQDAGYSGTVTIATVYSGAFDTLEITGNCTINGGSWTHTANTSAETYRLCVKVGGDLTVGSGGSINVSARGYNNNNGPGGSPDQPASYGGHGGCADGQTPPATYGSFSAPVDLGSSLSVAGGGAVALKVSGSTTVTGSIIANGDSANLVTGTGGSVLITTATISGGGTISANGGKTIWSGQCYATSGGGRVAVYLTQGGAGFSGLTVTPQAFGGNNSGDNVACQGAAGTVYLDSTDNSSLDGRLIIDNSDHHSKTWVTTAIPASGAWTTGLVMIKNRGNLNIVSGTSLTTNGTGTTITINGANDVLTNAGTLTIAGTGITNNGGTFTTTATTSSVTYTGQSNDATVTIYPTTYYSLIVNNSGTLFNQGGNTTVGVSSAGVLTITAGTYTLNAALDCNGSLSVNSGGLTAGGYQINVAGNWTNAGTFTHGNNTVILDGTNQTVSGSSTFYKLKKSVASAATLTFGAGATQTVSDSCVLKGASGQLLSLRSSSGGTWWKLNPAINKRDIQYVDVKDGNNTNATIIDPPNSVNSRNNINWFNGGEIDTVGLMALAVKTTATTCTLYTAKWTMRFDQSAGAGIAFLSDSTKGGGTNQITSGDNLFYIKYNGVKSSSVAGTLSLVSSTPFSACLRQSVTVSSQAFTNDYTVYGSGKMYVRTSVNGPVATNALEFMVSRVRASAGGAKIRPYTTTPASCPYILLGDTALRAHDILFAKRDTLSAGWSAYDTSSAASPMYGGWLNAGYTLAAGKREAWDFYIDVAHKVWDDTGGAMTQNVADYRYPDSLQFLIGNLQYEGPAWEDNIAGQWAFDEDALDTAYDVSGGYYNGKIYGATWTTGKINSALQFGGSTDTVIVPNNSAHAGSGDMTIMAWVKPSGSAIAAGNVIFAKGDDAPSYITGWKLTGSATGAAAFTGGNGGSGNTVTLTGATGLGTGVWHHVAVTSSPSSGLMTVFVDGRPDAFSSSAYTVGTNALNLRIGKLYTGALDDVRLYREVLADAQIKTIYQQGQASDQGLYALRADNNATAHFYIDGATTNRYYPIFRVINYWTGSTAPIVYVNGTRWNNSVADTLYRTSIDSLTHQLLIGLDTILTTDGVRVFVNEGRDSTGAFAVGAVATGYRWIGPDSIVVKNFSGNTFGASTAKEWAIMVDRTVGTTANDGCGGIVLYTTSETNASTSWYQSGYAPGTDDFADGTLDPAWTFHDHDNDGGTGSYTESGGQLSLIGRGADVWGSVNQYVVLIRSDVTGPFDISVKVVSQTNTHGWALSGIIAADDIDNLSSGGYCGVGVTPSNNFQFQYDLSGPVGEWETNIEGGTKAFPCWLRLVKNSSNQFTAYYKTSEGGSWNAIGSSPPPPYTAQSTASNSQVGLFSNSHNTSSTCTAVFDDFNTGLLSGNSLLSAGSQLNLVKWKYKSGATYDSTRGGNVQAGSNLSVTGVDTNSVYTKFTLSSVKVKAGSDSVLFTRQYTIYPQGKIFTLLNVSAASSIDSMMPAIALRKKESGDDLLTSYWGGTGAEDERIGGYYNAGAARALNHGVAFGYAAYQSGGKRGVSSLSLIDNVKKIEGSSEKKLFLADSSSRYTADSLQYRLALYYDISREFRTTASIDSVVNDVIYTNCAAWLLGTKDTTTYGDLDSNGYNEAEGCWVVKAANNSAKISLGIVAPVKAHFYPAIKVTNYNSSTKPQYVFLHSKATAGARDTVRLLEGYGYTAAVNTASKQLMIQIDSVFTDSIYIYLSVDITLAVSTSGFWATPGDGSDTLHWVTESESENLGFMLYRRVKPEFLDSLLAIIDTVDSTGDEANNAAILCKRGAISYVDTGWVPVFQRLIPGAKGGTSEGPRQYKQIDRAVQNDVLYQYKLVSVDFSNVQEEYKSLAEVMPRVRLPMAFALFRNYPNPFRTFTFIRYDLPKKSMVSLMIYDLHGRLVRRLLQPSSGMQRPGFYRVMWDGTDDFGRPLASGSYVYHAMAGKYRKARVMMLVR
jgi:hypothetical protein